MLYYYIFMSLLLFHDLILTLCFFFFIYCLCLGKFHCLFHQYRGLCLILLWLHLRPSHWRLTTYKWFLRIVLYSIWSFQPLSVVINRFLPYVSVIFIILLRNVLCHIVTPFLFMNLSLAYLEFHVGLKFNNDYCFHVINSLMNVLYISVSGSLSSFTLTKLLNKMSSFVQ